MNREQDIQTFFQEDHNRLERLFTLFSQKKNDDLDAAKDHFRAFKQGLQRHIVWEEEVLFPLFVEKKGAAAEAPVNQMKKEHRRIKKHLEAIHDRVADGRSDTDNIEENLVSVLEDHNMKEESIIYPAVNQALSTDEEDRTYDKLEAIPEEAYENCCESE